MAGPDIHHACKLLCKHHAIGHVCRALFAIMQPINDGHEQISKDFGCFRWSVVANLLLLRLVDILPTPKPHPWVCHRKVRSPRLANSATCCCDHDMPCIVAGDRYRSSCAPSSSPTIQKTSPGPPGSKRTGGCQDSNLGPLAFDVFRQP